MSTSTTHDKIAEIGGDGIGPEVMAEAIRVLEAAQGDNLHFAFERGAVGAPLYQRTGEDRPRDTVDDGPHAGIEVEHHPKRDLAKRDLGHELGAVQDPRARTREIEGEASERAAGDAVIKAL